MPSAENSFFSQFHKVSLRLIIQMRGLKGIIAVMLLLFWGPASIASAYAPAKSCQTCSPKEKKAGQTDGNFKFSSASQPAPNHFQLQQDDTSTLPYLPSEFVFVCPTLLGKALSANTRGHQSRVRQAFFSRLLMGSISAQAP
jgi:hypothetical protein